ncbi:MAG: hypothetical protein MJK12_07320 [Colwellia sp.]|nr:hypothetical protein [Colwellia sp.]
MIFVLSIMAIFVAISIYFFFRAEKLQREVILAKRDGNIARKENKVLIDSMALLASRYEEFARNRFQELKNRPQANEENIKQIAPLINNYSTIFAECLKGKERLKPITQRCYQLIDSSAFKEFNQYLGKRDAQIKRMWSSNNLNGFVSLVEALLVNLEQPQDKK